MLRPGTWVREMKTPDASALVSHRLILSPKPPGLVDYNSFLTKGTFEELIGGVRNGQFWFLKPISPHSGFIFHPQAPPWALQHLRNGILPSSSAIIIAGQNQSMTLISGSSWLKEEAKVSKWKEQLTIPQKSKVLKVTGQEFKNNLFLLLGCLIQPGYKGLYPVLL